MCMGEAAWHTIWCGLFNACPDNGRAGDQRVMREGSGTGESTASSPGVAHEFAAKAAETDATKRALSIFGNRFGLSLYGGTQMWRTSQPSGSYNENFEGDTRPMGFRESQLSRAGRTKAAHRILRWIKTPFNESVSRAVRLGPESATSPWPDIDPFEEAAARAAQKARIDKSKLFRSEVQRLRDPGHLRYVAGLSCLVCGRKPVHAHHLRFAQPKGLGRKVSDEFTVPLCNLHHRGFTPAAMRKLGGRRKAKPGFNRRRTLVNKQTPSWGNGTSIGVPERPFCRD